MEEVKEARVSEESIEASFSTAFVDELIISGLENDRNLFSLCMNMARVFKVNSSWECLRGDFIKEYSNDIEYDGIDWEVVRRKIQDRIETFVSLDSDSRGDYISEVLIRSSQKTSDSGHPNMR